MGKLAAANAIYSIFSFIMFYYGSIYPKRSEAIDTKSFQLVSHLTGQLDSQGTFVPCEARIVGYSVGRTSSRALRDTTRYFGTMTMWYRQYHLTWLWFCHSRIVVSPSCGLGGSTAGETTFLFTNQRRNGRACSSLTARGGGLPIGVRGGGVLAAEALKGQHGHTDKSSERLWYLFHWLASLFSWRSFSP